MEIPHRTGSGEPFSYTMLAHETALNTKKQPLEAPWVLDDALGQDTRWAGIDWHLFPVSQDRRRRLRSNHGLQSQTATEESLDLLLEQPRSRSPTNQGHQNRGKDRQAWQQGTLADSPEPDSADRLDLGCDPVLLRVLRL